MGRKPGGRALLEKSWGRRRRLVGKGGGGKKAMERGRIMGKDGMMLE